MPIRFRYDAQCHRCGEVISAGAHALWNRAAKTATCIACEGATEGGAPAADEPAAAGSTGERRSSIRLRCSAACSACGASMPPGSEAFWNKEAKRAAHVLCPVAEPTAAPVVESAAEVEPFDVGIAGGSARRIADRQQARRDRAKQQQDDAIRQAHPRIGNLLVKARDVLAEPEKPTSWQKGAAGEEAAGRTLDRLAAEGFVVLHDRRKPGTKWNIDHVVVGPRGVYVIDAKHYSGRLEIRPSGSLFRPGPSRVYVKGRAQDKRVAGMDWQVGWVQEAVGALLDEHGAVIEPVLCFLGVEVGLTLKPPHVGLNNVLVTWPRRFVKDAGRDGPLGAEDVAEVARRIARALPPAAPAHT